jgi:hypothetical protein
MNDRPTVKFDIPGLQSIRDERGPDGLPRIIFEIDDDKVDQFFEALGLQSGDEAGLHDVVIKSLTWSLKEREQK